MKLSVCMATYNGERFIKTQLDSVLKQLPADAELIISDDSSTDETVKIIESRNESRIILLKDQQFKSPIFNFENAIKHSTGEVIILSDQDDIWYDNKIDVIVKHMKSQTLPVILLMMNGDCIDAHGSILEGTMFQRRNAGRGILHNLLKNSYMGCNLAFTRTLLEKALPFPKTIPMHDSWLGLLAEIYGNVLFIETRTMQYRLHGDNASIVSSSFYDKCKWRWRLLWSILKRMITLWLKK